MDDFILQYQYSFKSQLLQVPNVDHSVLAASRKSAVPCRSLSTSKFEVCLPHISDDLELTLRIALIDHDPAVESANNKQAVFFDKDDADYRLVLVLVVLSGVDLLQEIAGLAAVLSHESSSIAHEELPALVAELTSSDVGVVVALVQLGEDLLEGSSDVVVDPDVVGGEEEDVVGH